MTDKRNRGSISAADEVAVAEANLKAAQERLAAARQRLTQEVCASSPDSCCCSDSIPEPTTSCCFDAAAAAQNPCGAPSASSAQYRLKPSKDRIAAGILAIFFGAFGIHKFYMGLTNTGFIMLAITIVGSLFTVGAAALVMQLIALVEGIIYFIKTQPQFEQDYVCGKRKWL